MLHSHKEVFALDIPRHSLDWCQCRKHGLASFKDCAVESSQFYLIDPVVAAVSDRIYHGSLPFKQGILTDK